MYIGTDKQLEKLCHEDVVLFPQPSCSKHSIKLIFNT